ncbi:MAG: alpha/beta hydrolase [Acidobacteriota bacterium]
MDIFFFGDEDKSLLGAFHDAGAARDLAVLLVPAHGHEYVRSHRAMHTLAGQLCASGCDVLRVELTGQGDSSGDDTDGDVGQWCQDIRLATDELRERSMARRIVAVGLRLGAALLASSVSDGTEEFDQIILWDPVINGAAYLGDLDRIHEQMLSDPHRFEPPRRASLPFSEQLGFAVTPSQRASIARLNLAEQTRWNCPRVFLVAGPDLADSSIEAVAEQVRASGSRIKTARLAALSGWQELRKVEDTLQAAEAVRMITAQLAGIAVPETSGVEG